MDGFITRGEHEEFVKRMEEEDKRQNKRIDLLEKAMEQNKTLTLSVEKMAINMEHMVEEQKKQGEKLEKMEHEPTKNMNTVKTAILNAIGGAIGTGIVALIIAGILLTKM